MVTIRRVRKISRKGQVIYPWYIAGFVDGEGSFHIAFTRRQDLPRKWAIFPEFHVSQNGSRAHILKAIQKKLKCGHIKANHAKSTYDKTFVFVVRDRNDLANKVIPFFDRYSLRAGKQQDYRKFKKIVQWMCEGKHFTHAGFRNIVNLAYTMNDGGKYRKTQKSTILDS